MLYFFLMKKLELDKKNTLVNLSNSILNFFDVAPLNGTYAPLDKLLKESKKEKIALILLDGMGKIVIEKHKDSIPFIYSHIFKEFKSVYPATTVAATTSLTTGLYPIQSGYLGWTQYFKDKNDFINVFPSQSKFDHTKKYIPQVQFNELKVDYIRDLINSTFKHNAYRIYTFDYRIGKNFLTDYEKFFDDADKLVKQHDFTYIYTENPDHLLHQEGVESDVIKDNLIYLESKIKTLVENNKDTLFLLTADHGFVNVKEINIKNYPDFLETLKFKNFSLEGRFATFFVKNEEKFIELAQKYFGNYFEIYSKKELIDNNVFGYGTPRDNVYDNIGDYTLVATKDYSLYDLDEPRTFDFRANHAGITPEETELYICVFNQ